MSTTSRGYGNSHQKLRKALAAAVEVGAVCCSRCGELIEAGEKWDLGHDDHDRSVYTGPEHPKMQQEYGGAAGAERGSALAEVVIVRGAGGGAKPPCKAA